MIRSHQITCAHDDCLEYSLRVPFKPAHPAWLAAEHRTQLAADGWTDVEGRDYCPQHNPTLETQR